MARFWMHQEKSDIEAGKPADAARERIKEWNALAEVTLAASLLGLV
jgi:hypothetical protein